MLANEAITIENGHILETGVGRNCGAEEAGRLHRLGTLRRLINGIEEHKAALQRLMDLMGSVLETLSKPGIGERARPAAICLGREFETGICALDETLAAAVDADPVIGWQLAPESASSGNRFAHLRRMAAPVRDALGVLIDPDAARTPFSMIHDGLELIECIKRHRRWLNRAVLSRTVSRCEQLSGARPLPLDPPGAVSGPASCGRPAGAIESRIQELIHDLELRTGLRLVPKAAHVREFA